MSNLSTVVVPGSNSASYQSTDWLALALTQGLGRTRIKKLIEHYGRAERVFQASLTELEATGMRRFRAIAGYGKVESRSKYPKENTRLAEQIVALGGALISEFPVGTFPAPQKLSHPQPDHQRHVRRRTGGRSRGIQQHAHHFPLCPRTKPRRLRRSGQRNQQEFLGARIP
jgi:hypothetical protein